MQNRYPLGAPFHGDFSSADASALSEANSRFNLYGSPKLAADAALTLDANDYVIVTDVSVSVGAAALVVQLYDGADATVDPGELIAKHNLPANGNATWSRHAPHTCQQGTWPKVKASAAGQVDCVISGYIYRHTGT